MKRFIFTLVIAIISMKISSKCNDSIFLVKAKKIDTVDFKIKLIFENVSSDTILLFSNFKNYRENFSAAPGIRISFYRNHQFFFPQEGENPTKYYKIGDGRIKIHPKSKIEYEIDLNQYIWRPKENEEYGVSIDINYRYYVMSADKNKRVLYNSQKAIDYFKINDVSGIELK